MTGTRVLLFITIFLFIGFKSFSAVFTVTSNADSGPGTLREALTLAAANGIVEKDYINFNLPGASETDRTIPLLTQLPDVSSNLVIDGTTQPGTKFGVSDAKIKITHKFVYPNDLATFNGNSVDKVEIYGLWLNNDMTGWGGSAFLFKNFGTVHIGAPSKGNLIEWGNLGFQIGRELFFQNNICWTDETGLLPKGGDITIKRCKSVTFGGSENAGNVVAGSTNIIFTEPTGNILNLSYNKMGTDYTGKSSPDYFYIERERVDIEGYNADLGMSGDISINAIIKNNVIADVYDADLLRIGGLSGKITIQGNAFNTDLTGTENLNLYSHAGPFSGIVFSGKADVLIGGDDPSQKNFIAYCSQAVTYNPLSSSPNFVVSKNSIFCYWDEALMPYPSPNIPKVTINTVSNSLISGTSVPGADIELFNADCSCSMPGPKYYFTTVKADNTGKWVYSGPVNGYIMASATYNKVTGKFVGASIDDSQAVITNASCTAKGSVTGIKTPYTTGIGWYNEQNQPVGNSIDLKDVPAGNYTLKINTGTPCQLTKQYQIVDKSLIVDVSNIYIKPASCGSSNGLIWGIKTNVPSILTWHGANMGGTVYGTEVSNIPTGNYTFTFTNLDGSCPQTISPIIVKSVDGPNIDQSHPDIQSTSCGQSAGSIKNIIVTGTGNIKYSWLDAQHQEVANTNDLTGQPAGIYTLKVTDDSQCGEIYSSEINIPEINGITLDENNVVRSPTTCSQNNGRIKGITAPGATHYKWINTANNNTAGSGIDLSNAAAGNYQLIASNDFGCSKKSQVYTVETTPATVYPLYSAYIIKSCAGQGNGSITLITDNLVKSMRWVDAAGQPAGSDANTHDLKPGTYKVYFTDANGCETLYPHDFTVDDIPALQIDGNSIVQTNDQCGLKTGSIKHIQVTGGTPPYTYLWVDAAGNHLSTSNDLTGVGEGSYSLQIHDSGSSACSPYAGIAFNISNENSTIDAPVLNPLQLCAPGEALLTVSAPAAGNKYRLYNSLTDPTYLDEQTNGIFKISANANSTYYICRVNGQCESERTAAQITVSLSAIDIPNAFTPNGDGKNDYWKINNAQNYPQAVVQVFTRYGQKVFESKGYTVPFDGTYNGSKLPAGVYYYILNLGKSCKLLSGNLTLIR